MGSLSVGKEVMKRLADVPEFKCVLTMRDIKAVKDNEVPLPAAMVIYGGDSPASLSSDSELQLVPQKWLVEVVVSSHSDNAENELEEAGDLMDKVIEALQGWQPVSAIEPMKRLPGPQPVYLSGLSLYPLVFETLVISG